MLATTIIPILIIGLSIFKWKKPILDTIHQDDDFDDLDRIISQRGVRYWFRHIKLLWTLRYRWLKSWIALRLYSNHSTISKGVLALAISLVAYFEATQSPVVAGATVFYATMIFIQSTPEYAALWSQSMTMSRLDYDGVTDSLGVATEVNNLGLKTADNIEAELRVIDGPRNLSGSTTPDRRKGNSNVQKLEPNLNRDYSFTFAGRSETLGDVKNRAAMNGELGEIAFAVIEIQTPDQPVKTVKYKNISRAETQTLEELQELFGGLSEGVNALEEYTMRSYSNETADLAAETDHTEGDDGSLDTGGTNQIADTNEATDSQSENEGTEDKT